MTPNDTWEEKVQRYRQMTGEQRVKIALDMNEAVLNAEREHIRQQNPDASPDEVERLLRHRRMLAFKKT